MAVSYTHLDVYKRQGYTAAAVDTNGKQFKLPIIMNKDSGLVEVNNKNVTSGIITITYSGTWIQKASALRCV